MANTQDSLDYIIRVMGDTSNVERAFKVLTAQFKLWEQARIDAENKVNSVLGKMGTSIDDDYYKERKRLLKQFTKEFYNLLRDAANREVKIESEKSAAIYAEDKARASRRLQQTKASVGAAIVEKQETLSAYRAMFDEIDAKRMASTRNAISARVVEKQESINMYRTMFGDIEAQERRSVSQKFLSTKERIKAVQDERTQTVKIYSQMFADIEAQQRSSAASAQQLRQFRAPNATQPWSVGNREFNSSQNYTQGLTQVSDVNGIKKFKGEVSNLNTAIVPATNNARKYGDALKHVGTSGHGAGEHLKVLGTDVYRMDRLLIAFAAKQYADNIFNAFKSLVKIGFEFNSMKEQTQLGIAGIVSSYYTLTDAYGNVLTGVDKFNAAQVLAADTFETLRGMSLKTTATVEDLTKAYQEAASIGSSFGLSREQLAQFTLNATLMAQALRIKPNELGQEMRGIMTGDTNPRTSRMAFQIWSKEKNEGQDVAAFVKELQASGADKFMAVLNERMASFAEIGLRSASTFEGAMSNIKEAIQAALGEETHEAFEITKGLLVKIQDGLIQVDEAGNVLVTSDFLDFIRDSATGWAIIADGIFEATKNLLGFNAASKDKTKLAVGDYLETAIDLYKDNQPKAGPKEQAIFEDKDPVRWLKDKIISAFTGATWAADPKFREEVRATYAAVPDASIATEAANRQIAGRFDVFATNATRREYLELTNQINEAEKTGNLSTKKAVEARSKLDDAFKKSAESIKSYIPLLGLESGEKGKEFKIGFELEASTVEYFAALSTVAKHGAPAIKVFGEEINKALKAGTASVDIKEWAAIQKIVSDIENGVTKATPTATVRRPAKDDKAIREKENALNKMRAIVEEYTKMEETLAEASAKNAEPTGWVKMWIESAKSIDEANKRLTEFQNLSKNVKDVQNDSSEAIRKMAERFTDLGISAEKANKFFLTMGVGTIPEFLEKYKLLAAELEKNRISTLFAPVPSQVVKAGLGQLPFYGREVGYGKDEYDTARDNEKFQRAVNLFQKSVEEMYTIIDTSRGVFDDLLLTGGKNFGQIAGSSFNALFQQGSNKLFESFSIFASGMGSMEGFIADFDKTVKETGFFKSDITKRTYYEGQGEEAYGDSVTTSLAKSPLYKALAFGQIGYGNYSNIMASGNDQSIGMGAISGGVSGFGVTSTWQGAVVGAIVGAISTAYANQQIYDSYKYGIPTFTKGKAGIGSIEEMKDAEVQGLIAAMQKRFNTIWNEYQRLILKFPTDLAVTLPDVMGGKIQKEASKFFLKHFQEWLDNVLPDTIAQEFNDALISGFGSLGVIPAAVNRFLQEISNLGAEDKLQALNDWVDALKILDDVTAFLGLDYMIPDNPRRGVRRPDQGDDYWSTWGVDRMDDIRQERGQSFGARLKDSDAEIIQFGNHMQSLVGPEKVAAAKELANMFQQRMQAEKEYLESMIDLQDEIKRGLDGMRRQYTMDLMHDAEGNPDYQKQVDYLKEYAEGLLGQITTASSPEEMNRLMTEYQSVIGQIVGLGSAAGGENYDSIREWALEALDIAENVFDAQMTQMIDEVVAANKLFADSVLVFVNAIKDIFGTGYVAGSDGRGGPGTGSGVGGGRNRPIVPIDRQQDPNNVTNIDGLNNYITTSVIPTYEASNEAVIAANSSLILLNASALALTNTFSVLNTGAEGAAKVQENALELALRLQEEYRNVIAAINANSSDPFYEQVVIHRT